MGRSFRLLALPLLASLMVACSNPIKIQRPSVTLATGTSTLSAVLGKEIPVPVTFTPPPGATGTYSITPDLTANTGLTFRRRSIEIGNTGLIYSTNIGEIVGKPTKLSPATDYTITFTGDGISHSGSGTVSVKIGVNNGIITGMTASSGTLTAYVDTAISSLTFTPIPSSATGTYAIIPDLTKDTGLNFDTGTGAITGTPTKERTATNYTITFIGAGDYRSTARATVSITVKGPQIPLTGLKANRGTLTASVGTAISSLTFTTTPSSATGTYTIIPDLANDTGLNFNTTTGAITGTPTKAKTATTYTITLTGTGGYKGTATDTVSITVNKGSLTGLTASSKTLTATVGKKIPSLTFKTAPSSATGTYIIRPTLSAGLSINKNTGAITGTPARAQTAISYTITFTGTGDYTGTAKDTVSISVKAPLEGLTASAGSYIAGKNVAIVNSPTFTKDPPTATGTYSISPTLPAGLNINADTGAIRGTATGAQAATLYTITFNGTVGYTGSVTATVSVTVLARGDSYGGGKIFYFDGKGGGLIAATSDQSTGIAWGGFEIDFPGADGTAIGTGKQNTADIVAKLGDNGGTAYAAKLASDYTVKVSGVTYDDWFLPSKDELNEMYKYRSAIGGFDSENYWSSSEDSSENVWIQFFGNGLSQTTFKEGYSERVRVVRVF